MRAAEAECDFNSIELRTAGSYRHEQFVRESAQLELALAYSRAGMPVFLVDPRTKAPLTKHGHKDATTGETSVRNMCARWPSGLVAIPTGSRTGLFVLDVDGALGLRSLGELLALLGLETVEDLSPVIAETPSGGLHIYFRLPPGEQPRTRASDIGPGLDTRGEGGYIIAPGNVRPDGLRYRHIGRRHDLADAPTAPSELTYLATFNARERDLIADNPDLTRAVRAAAPSAWPGILQEHRQNERERLMARFQSYPPDSNAMRRQAVADLAVTADAYAALTDGRRNGLFAVSCRLAKYVAHEVLSEAEVCAALEAAGVANGATGKHGRDWIAGTIRRGLAYGANDPLPPLARKFREVVR